MASQEERDRIMAEYLAQVQGGDDDDDEEAEFQPGDDDDEDEPLEDFQEEEEDDYVWMKGELTYKKDSKQLVYKGQVLADAFEFHSSQDMHWDWQQPTAVSPDPAEAPLRMRTISMEGTIGKHSTQVELTFRAPSSDLSNGNSSPAGMKTAHEEEADGKMPASADDDQKKPAASPSRGKRGKSCSVFGTGSDSSGSFDFHGTLSLPGEAKDSIPLHCQKRAATQPAAAAAAVAAAPDEDDVEDEADEGVDYDELIALHQDAGLSMTDLRKRYSEEDGVGPRKRTRTQNQGAVEAAAAAGQGTTGDNAEGDDESDDDYGF